VSDGDEMRYAGRLFHRLAAKTGKARSHVTVCVCVCACACVCMCRVVNTAMKCFHDIKNNIRRRCREEGADEYQLNYIAPLVDQTRDTVLAECSLQSPYIEYFLSGAPSPPPHRRALLTAAVAALTVAHLIAADAV